MVPLLGFFATIIDFFVFIIIGSAILSWLIAFNVINVHNQFVYTIYNALNRLTEPLLAPIRRFLPDLGGIDISPVILIFALFFLRDVVIHGWMIPYFQTGRRLSDALWLMLNTPLFG